MTTRTSTHMILTREQEHSHDHSHDHSHEYSDEYSQENKNTIKDRKYHLKTYKKCFVGKKAVSWLVDQKISASRTAAVKCMQALLDAQLIHHVVDDHEFKDDYLFYRFREDEVAGGFDPVKLRDIGNMLRRTVEIRDRKWRLRIFRNCFIGKDAVDALVVAGAASSRDEVC